MSIAPSEASPGDFAARVLASAVPLRISDKDAWLRTNTVTSSGGREELNLSRLSLLEGAQPFACG